MSRLLGGVAEVGSVLDPKRFWRAAGRQQVRGARMLAANRLTRKVEIVNEGGEPPTDCVFLMPEDEDTQEQDAVWVGLHGILHNLRELAQQSGVSHCGEYSNRQSEIVRQCYKVWGASCLSMFRGSFACAILDLRNNKLLLARDHVGSKSLFFSTRGGFYFASTIKAVIEMSGLSFVPNLPVVRDWLLDIPTDDPTQTFFDGIIRLPPASWLELNLSGPTSHSITQFWRLEDVIDRGIERKDAGDCLRALLSQSIELSTRETATAGITLSGGLDSSVMLAALRNCKGKLYPIHSFTFLSGTRESRGEESRAHAVAELCGCDSHLVRYDCHRIPNEMDDLLLNLEEPFASPVLFAHRELYRVAEATGMQTVLNGHGSDSLFAGSNSHLITMAASLWRQGRIIRACTMLANAASGYSRVRLLKSVVGAGLPPGIKAVLRPKAKPGWLKDKWFQERNAAPGNAVKGQANKLRTQRVRELQALSLPYTLRFEEFAAEAYFVRSLSPFLAPEVVEFALSLPEELLIGRDGFTKSILRSASQDLLPKTFLENRERSGFPIPAAEWLRSLSPWAAGELARSRQLPFIDAAKVLELWRSFEISNGSNWRIAIQLWRLILLTRWAQAFETRF